MLGEYHIILLIQYWAMTQLVSLLSVVNIWLERSRELDLWSHQLHIPKQHVTVGIIRKIEKDHMVFDKFGITQGFLDPQS